VVFWATVLNAPANWVFSLSSSVQSVGVVAVYANVDVFNPFDTSAINVSVSAGQLPAITASLDGEELAAFVAAAGNGNFTPAANYQQASSKATATASISFQHKQLQAAGPQTTVSETFSGAGAGAAVIVAIAPSQGTTTYDDAYQRVFEALPPGIDSLLDFTPTGDFYKYFWVFGSVLKLCFDLLDIARRELVPYLSRYKLPDWERLFGLRGTFVAQAGTIPQRQSQVLGAWRAAGGQGASIPTVQAILGPLLGYFPTTVPQIIEADPTALKLLHSYGFTGDVTIANGATATITILVSDGGKVGDMGAQLEIAFSVSAFTGTITLTGPDGTSVSWTGPAAGVSGWAQMPMRLYAPGRKTQQITTAGGKAAIILVPSGFGGKQIQGGWTLSVTNNSGGSVTLFDGPVLFVEGIARGQDTGGAIFRWGVYADPTHLGENGTPANFAAARAAINVLAFSHTVGNLIQSLAPYPDVVSGVHAAICDECLPV
jgi:hypothetical protein